MLYRAADGTFAAALGALVVGAGFYLGCRVGRAGHKAAQGHRGQVVQVVAAVGSFLARVAVPGHKVPQKVCLAADILVNIGDFQVGGAAADGLALAPGADHDPDACGAGQHQPGPVLDGKFLQLVAGGVVVNAAVGHRAVNVQHQ